MLDARAAHPGSTLADLYDPLAMPADLRAAHHRLDKLIDHLYQRKAFRHDTERVQRLFEKYDELNSPLAPAPAAPVSPPAAPAQVSLAIGRGPVATLFRAVARRQVAALLDVRRPVPGVTHGTPAPELRPLGAPQRRPGAPDDQLHPAEGHFGLRAQWGTRSGGTVLPGKGRTTPTPGLEATHLNIWLNEEACWAAVPVAVWATTLGGYPVLKKWLSYRAAPVLARDLLPDEVQEFTRLVRRLAALLALAPALDAAYAASAAAPVAAV